LLTNINIFSLADQDYILVSIEEIKKSTNKNEKYL